MLLSGNMYTNSRKKAYSVNEIKQKGKSRSSISQVKSFISPKKTLDDKVSNSTIGFKNNRISLNSTKNYTQEESSQFLCQSARL